MTAPRRDRSHCHLHLIVDVFVVLQQRIAESQGRCCCRVEEFAGVALVLITLMMYHFLSYRMPWVALV